MYVQLNCLSDYGVTGAVNKMESDSRYGICSKVVLLHESQVDEQVRGSRVHEGHQWRIGNQLGGDRDNEGVRSSDGGIEGDSSLCMNR